MFQALPEMETLEDGTLRAIWTTVLGTLEGPIYGAHLAIFDQDSQLLKCRDFPPDGVVPTAPELNATTLVNGGYSAAWIEGAYPTQVVVVRDFDAGGGLISPPQAPQ
ncbi:hypothetical protein AB9K41_04580 [Cribrihabitans sp. XS_ASV171]